MIFSYNLKPSIIADIILVIHAGLALFLSLGFVVIVFGWILKWKWPRNPWFRVIHIGAMAVISGLTLIGQHCPLTIWEGRLRGMGNMTVRGDSPFVRLWVSRLLFYDAPDGFFLALYLVSVVILGCLLWAYPPRFKKKS